MKRRNWPRPLLGSSLSLILLVGGSLSPNPSNKGLLLRPYPTELLSAGYWALLEWERDHLVDVRGGH